jgi:hypothetical protein
MVTGVEGEVETEEGEEETGEVETTNGEGGETAATEEAVEVVTDREVALEVEHREEEEVVVAGILVLLKVEEEAVELREVATTKPIQASSKMYWISKEWMK